MFQGHLNDTIVVNQPRLSPDDEMIVPTGAEMTLVTDSDGNHKLLPADQVVSLLNSLPYWIDLICVVPLFTGFK